MIAIQGGVRPAQVIEALKQAAREAGNAASASTAEQLLGRYREWAMYSLQVLRPLVAAAELDRLIATRRYWAVDAGVDHSSPSSYANAIRLELASQQELLDREAQELQDTERRWNAPNSLALVPDTSVFVALGGSFAIASWHELASERSDVFIYVVVSMAVVRELDGKKLSRDNSEQGKSVRANVRSALRKVEEIFPTNQTQAPANSIREGDVVAFANIVLLSDSRGHEPLASTDTEVIERAVSLLPFVDRVALVTYDVNQAFSARTAGLGEIRLRYEYETS